jgi:hypothetical protein|tara:strand:+ start:355 stop:804 length:450 start_codon:yes stop_codon:yes gene_type:complete
MSIEQESNVLGLSQLELFNPGPRTVGIGTVDGPSTDGNCSYAGLPLAGTIEVSENVLLGTEEAILGPFMYFDENSVLAPAAGSPNQPLAICLPKDRTFVRVNMHNVYINGKMPMTSTDFTEATGTTPLRALTGPNTQLKIVFGNNIPIT